MVGSMSEPENSDWAKPSSREVGGGGSETVIDADTARRGVIKGYRAVLDYELRGLPISAFVSVTPLDYSQEADIPGKLHELEGVVSCYSIAGAPSFMLVVRVSSPSKLEELLNRIHRTVPVSTESTVILQTYF